MRYRELICESCGAGLRLHPALESAEAWHSTCPKRTPRGAFPRYVSAPRSTEVENDPTRKLRGAAQSSEPWDTVGYDERHRSAAQSSETGES